MSVSPEPVSHLHIVHSTEDDESIRVSGPLAADTARQEFDLGYPSEFEDEQDAVLWDEL